MLQLPGAAHLGPYTDQQPQLSIVERETLAFLDRYLKHIPGARQRMWRVGNVPGVAQLVTSAPAAQPAGAARRRGRYQTMTGDDPHELERFLAAQDGGTYARAVAELRAGHKTSHWMWFVFPQIAGLGRSPTAQRYAIASLDEARAYLAHPVLGARLRECRAAAHRTARTLRAGDLWRHRRDEAALVDDAVRARRSRGSGLRPGPRALLRR